MLRKITFLWRRRNRIGATFKHLKSHPVEESTNLVFVTLEERIRSSRQKLHRHGFQPNLEKTWLMTKVVQQRKGLFRQ